MSSSQTLVSILVPCFNAARFVEAALQSALDQTWQKTEIIAVDDGSTDDTFARMQPFAKRGVRLLQQKNAGASAARNRAFAEARGSHIQFLDADDILSPNKVALQIESLIGADAGKVAACSWGRFAASPADAVFAPEAIWRDQSAIDFLVTCALEELMFPPAAWLVPRGLCEIAGPWNETLSMNDDGEYIARVLAASTGIVFCGEGRVYYRSGNPASYGSRQTGAAARSELIAWDHIVATMLHLEKSDRVKRAAATGYQRIQVRHYGRFPNIVTEAERKERIFGGGSYLLRGGSGFVALAQLAGWKRAMRLRGAKARVLDFVDTRQARRRFYGTLSRLIRKTGL